MERIAQVLNTYGNLLLVVIMVVLAWVIWRYVRLTSLMLQLARLCCEL